MQLRQAEALVNTLSFLAVPRIAILHSQSPQADGSGVGGKTALANMDQPHKHRPLSWDSEGGWETADPRGVQGTAHPSSLFRWHRALILNFLPEGGREVVSGEDFRVWLIKFQQNDHPRNPKQLLCL